MLGGPQSQCGRFRRQKDPLPLLGVEPRLFVCPTSSLACIPSPHRPDLILLRMLELRKPFWRSGRKWENDIKRDLKEMHGKTWLRIAAVGGCCEPCNETSGFIKTRGLFWIAEKPLASEGIVCSMNVLWIFVSISLNCAVKELNCGPLRTETRVCELTIEESY